MISSLSFIESPFTFLLSLGLGLVDLDGLASRDSHDKGCRAERGIGHRWQQLCCSLPCQLDHDGTNEVRKKKREKK